MASRREQALGRGPLYEKARAQLLDVAALLERLQIPYHLEGGTLLGIVRDGDLLPWDNDVDLSIPAEAVAALEQKALPELRGRGLRISVRHMDADGVAWKRGDARLFKIRPRRWLLLPGSPCVDIFVKHRAQGHAWWQAEEKVMRVPERFYDGFDPVVYAGTTLHGPRDVPGYLELKYGDWRTPVKDWQAGRDEKTIVGGG